MMSGACPRCTLTAPGIISGTMALTQLPLRYGNCVSVIGMLKFLPDFGRFSGLCPQE